MMVAQATHGTCKNQYELTTEVRFTQFLLDTKVTQRVALRQRLSLTALESGEAGNWFALVIDESTGEIDGQPLSLPGEYAPFAFKRSADGLIVDFWFPQWVDPETQQQFRSLAYLFQFIEAPEIDGFQRREKDLNGTYLAKYRIRGEEIVKNKIKYETLGSDVGDGKIEIVASEFSYTNGPCLLRHLDSKEQLTITITENMRSDNHSTVTLAEREEFLNSTIFDLPPNVMEWRRVVAATNLSGREVQASPDELLDFLASHDLTDIDSFTLAMHLQEFSGALPALLPSLSGNALTDDERMRLINALGLVDTTESQYLLASVLSSSEIAPNDKFRALQALAGTTVALAPDAYDVLSELLVKPMESTDVVTNNSLLFTVGTIIGRRPDDPLAKELEFHLVDKLSNTEDYREREAIIGALGNTRSATATDTINDYVYDKNRRVQLAAIESLGRIGTKGAYTTLSTLLNDDLSETARTVVLSSLERYPLDSGTRNRVLEFAATDPDPRTRRAAIAALSSPRTKTPEVRLELKALLRTERSRENFKLLVRSIHSD
tara:strand:+ start:19886 stop:21532 length:1647 start_codon:yes stop_codon:yes gene_type:complete